MTLHFDSSRWVHPSLAAGWLQTSVYEYFHDTFLWALWADRVVTSTNYMFILQLPASPALKYTLYAKFFSLMSVYLMMEGDYRRRSGPLEKYLYPKCACGIWGVSKTTPIVFYVNKYTTSVLAPDCSITHHCPVFRCIDTGKCCRKAAVSFRFTPPISTSRLLYLLYFSRVANLDEALVPDVF